MSDQIIYPTGITQTGELLMGGVWKLWNEAGFPIEMSWLFFRDQNWGIDWMEAMADASTSNNLPSLMEKIAAFLPQEEIGEIKVKFMCLLRNGKNYEQILADKKSNFLRMAEFVAARQ
jgi:hypothetical protein